MPSRRITPFAWNTDFAAARRSAPRPDCVRRYVMYIHNTRNTLFYSKVDLNVSMRLLYGKRALVVPSPITYAAGYREDPEPTSARGMPPARDRRHVARHTDSGMAG